MGNGGGNPLASDQSRKELAVSLAASSMINASDMITPEAYQANPKHIQNAKEMAWMVEMNNKAAHKNFLVDQLEKRAKEGREAENMLARLRNQPGLPETVQFTNNAPSDNILPTTATLVEVPDSSASYSSSAPATTSLSPQIVQYDRPANYQWNDPAPQVQPYYPDTFRYYVPPSTTIQPPQYNAVLHTQAPVDPGKIGWYTGQNQPMQSRAHNPLAQTRFQPTQTQQPSQSWSKYPPQVTALSTTTAISGHHTLPVGWNQTTSAHGGPSTDPSIPMYREPGISVQSTASRPPAAIHNQPLNFASPARVPLQGVPVVPAQPSFGQPPPMRSHPGSAEVQFRPVSTAVSKSIAISELQRPHKLPQQPQQHEQPQRLSEPQMQFQQQQPQIRQFPQPSLQPQRHPHQPQAQRLFQQPPQPSQTHQQAPPPSADRVSTASLSQPRTQPSQQPQPTSMEERARQRGTQKPRVDQATFIRLFRGAVQHGTLQLKAFWFHAKASGITDEWFKAAIESLPRHVWQSALAQASQSVPTLDAPPPANVPQGQTPIGLDVSGGSGPPLTAIPVVQITPTTQQATNPNVSTEGNTTYSAPKQSSESYATQVQYYAEQATKSALSGEVASISASSPGNIALAQTMLSTPKRDVPQAQPNVRTPRDANKSTLARDVLHALGKTAQTTSREMGGEPAGKVSHHKSDQRLPEVVPPQPISRPVSSKPPAVSLETGLVDANSLVISSENPGAQDGPQHAASPRQPIAKPVLKEGQAAVIEGPIMIDLTLEDSDESIDGKRQEPTFLMRTSASAATSSQPASATNTTSHTPLLENLSLEELPTDDAGDSNNADVHLHSPPLGLVAEEKMESELLYPPPDSMEPALSSFEPLPSEANEHPLDDQLPLFLPSPPASPAPTEPPATEPETTNDEGESRSSLKRRSVDADKMEIDTGMATPPRVRKRRKQQVYVLVPPAPLYVQKAKMKERAMAEGIDLGGVGQEEELQYSHLEQLLIDDSKFRLLERRCRWLNCAAILNCAANLLTHLKAHAREEGLQASFLCRWLGCQRQFSTEQERDKHLERHTIRPLPCPFAGCDKQFDKPVEVMQHEVQHQITDRREPLIPKPTCQPMVPAIPARLGPPPLRLPAHRVIPRRVVKCQISADRHATVGPWVLWNIFSPVDLNMRKQNASMRGRPMRQTLNYDVDSSDPRRDDYDFLLAVSSYPAKDPQLDDLDSALITMSSARGLTLWGSVNSTAGSATPEEHTGGLATVVDVPATSSATDETRVEEDEVVAAAASGGSITSGGGPSGQSMATGEEDAVERMLIL